jgi:hypothetical protein
LANEREEFGFRKRRDYDFTDVTFVVSDFDAKLTVDTKDCLTELIGDDSGRLMTQPRQILVNPGNEGADFDVVAGHFCFIFFPGELTLL